MESYSEVWVHVLYNTLILCEISWLLRCTAGDVVVSVNGQNLAGLTRQEASALIKNSPDIVDLQILRGKPAKMMD